MIQITLNKIEESEPCKPGWRKVLRAHEKLGRDTEFSLLSVLNSNGLDDTVWCMRCLPEYESLWRKYGVWCAEKVEHLMTDDRSKNALRVAWRHSDGLATDQELSAVRDAAAAACDAARATARATARDAAGATARATARDAADAAGAAWAAAWDVRATALDAALGAARAAAWAAWAARDARDAARDAQQAKLVEIITAGKWIGGAPWDVEND